LSANEVAGCWSLTGKSLMAIRKPLIWLSAASALVIILVAVLLLRYEVKQHDPCTQLSRIELANTYAALGQLLQRQNLESNQLLARQRAEDFTINLEMSSDQVDLEEALKSSTRQIDEVAALRQRQSREFQALCRKVVDQ